MLAVFLAVSFAAPSGLLAQDAGVVAVGAGKNLRGQSFAGKELRSEVFDNANLEGADFTLANVSGSTFRRANLRAANLKRSNFSDTDLTGADLRKATLFGTRFLNAKLRNANLEEQDLYLAGHSAELEEIGKLPGEMRSDLSTRDYGLVDLNSGRLTLQGANLRNARIFGNLQDVDLRRADLRGADLSSTTNIEKAELRGAVYDRRTRWGVDPDRVGARRGEDIGISSKWFVGDWIIDTRRGAEPETANLGILKLAAEGTFSWNPGAGQGERVIGRWTAETQEGGSPAAYIQAGELGLNWNAKPQGDTLVLSSDDGKRKRSASRDIGPK